VAKWETPEAFSKQAKPASFPALAADRFNKLVWRYVAKAAAWPLFVVLFFHAAILIRESNKFLNQLTRKRSSLSCP